MTNRGFRYFFVIGVVVFSLIVGWGFAEIKSGQSNTCSNIKVIAAINRESVARAASPEAQKIIAKISFPGLSHKELIKLIHEGTLHEKFNLRQLEKVQRDSCG
jgi:hypothetical protein